MKIFLNISDIARLLKVDKLTVYRYIWNKKLKAVRIKNKYFVYARTADLFRENRIKEKTGYAKGHNIKKSKMIGGERNGKQVKS